MIYSRWQKATLKAVSLFVSCGRRDVLDESGVNRELRISVFVRSVLLADPEMQYRVERGVVDDYAVAASILEVSFNAKNHGRSLR